MEKKEAQKELFPKVESAPIGGHHQNITRELGTGAGMTHHSGSRVGKERLGLATSAHSEPRGVPCTRCAHGDTLCFPVRRALSTMMAVGS